jgi:kelch-like protein 10
LKKKRSGFGTISYENYIYIIGGNDGENILNSVDILDILTGEWTRAESMLEMRDELAVCLGKDNKIYAIGGFGGKNN